MNPKIADLLLHAVEKATAVASQGELTYIEEPFIVKLSEITTNKAGLFRVEQLTILAMDETGEITLVTIKALQWHLLVRHRLLLDVLQKLGASAEEIVFAEGEGQKTHLNKVEADFASVEIEAASIAIGGGQFVELQNVSLDL